jgi:hypothetical protein
MTELLALLAAAEVVAAAPPTPVPLERVTRVGVQTWDAPPERVLPLLTPLGERAWAVGWEPEMRWQAPGDGEGTIFVTRSHGPGETVWILQTFDAAHGRVAYVHTTPGFLVVELTLSLSAAPGDRTRAEIRYTFTALSDAGNARIAQMTEAHYAEFMRDWERELNHFLRMGRKLDAPHHP